MATLLQQRARAGACGVCGANEDSTCDDHVHLKTVFDKASCPYCSSFPPSRCDNDGHYASCPYEIVTGAQYLLIKHQLAHAPKTWVPGLLAAIVERAVAESVFVAGGVIVYVNNVLESLRTK